MQKARVEKGLSQKQLADLLSMTRGCYAHYEQGIREPTIAVIVKMCRVLEISSDYLIGLSDNY